MDGPLVKVELATGRGLARTCAQPNLHTGRFFGHFAHGQQTFGREEDTLEEGAVGGGSLPSAPFTRESGLRDAERASGEAPALMGDGGPMLQA